ncbi:unnamed protein product [Allacma fusca]|uniref:Uncharacterized protein n=1 Tax=Allacma fusca TaxID=39272 RepID=A0A8J2NML1_9HEXA|nr:unnamed protein product [Allacma fusca]
MVSISCIPRIVYFETLTTEDYIFEGNIVNMRRGGEDELLAISPPPEFQDNPALPPPVLFQDLSPSPNADPRKSSLILSQAVQKCIKEFADKVSYNILNEAMIIATLIPSSGINDGIHIAATL